jgi:hypothetical protein
MTDLRVLGTGFIAAPGRLMTAGHVLDDTITLNAPDMARHRDGDIYYLIRHEEDGFSHYFSMQCERDKELFTYAGVDLGIIHLPARFYSSPGLDKKYFLEVASDFSGIATPVGVLGYPLTQLDFDGGDLNKPKIGDVLLRADRGVINTRYTLPGDIKMFEFTMAFINGNSGGPIIDIKSGKVVSWVQGYRKVDIEVKEKDLPPSFTAQKYSLTSYIEVAQAAYSIGVATASVVDKLKTHAILS